MVIAVEKERLKKERETGGEEREARASNRDPSMIGRKKNTTVTESSEQNGEGNVVPDSHDRFQRPETRR